VGGVVGGWSGHRANHPDVRIVVIRTRVSEGSDVMHATRQDRSQAHKERHAAYQVENGFIPRRRGLKITRTGS
jgi:hypothetical protein